MAVAVFSKGNLGIHRVRLFKLGSRFISLMSGWLVLTTMAMGQPSAAPSDSAGNSPWSDPAAILPSPTPTADPFNETRILGVIPDYQTVTETPGGHVAPLTARQKWSLALKETVDPFNLVNAMVGAGFSQIGNQTPRYGEGMPAFSERFGAAVADYGMQNFFSAGVLATVLHQDPRYFRKGPAARVPSRVLYSVSRLLICRQDSGHDAFNASGIFGMALGIGASNLYYPSASIRGRVMAARVETSLFGGVTGNLMSEFWPDLQKRFFHKKHHD